MTVTPKEVRKMLSFFVIMHIYVCHFIISSPPIYRRRRRDPKQEKRRTDYVCICTYVCMYVCLWPIGIVYMHVAHTNTNGISLCCRHSRPTKKKRTRGRESTSFFVYRQTPVETKKGESERKKISARYTPLYVPILYIDVGIRCCHCCRLCWQQ